MEFMILDFEGHSNIHTYTDMEIAQPVGVGAWFSAPQINPDDSCCNIIEVYTSSNESDPYKKVFKIYGKFMKMPVRINNFTAYQSELYGIWFADCESYGLQDEWYIGAITKLGQCRGYARAKPNTTDDWAGGKKHFSALLSPLYSIDPLISFSPYVILCFHMQSYALPCSPKIPSPPTLSYTFNTCPRTFYTFLHIPF